MSEAEMVTESREVSGFDGVALGGFGAVTITQGDGTALTIEAPADVMPRVVSEVKDGVLVLRLKKTGWLSDLRKKKLSICFHVTMKDVRMLRLGGVGRIDAEKIDTKSLSLVVSGVGAMEIDSLTADALDVVLSGSGSCEVAGRVKTQDVELSGSGNYLAPNLESATASAVVSGAGNMTIRAHDTLDARVSGAGNIRYHGAPTVRQRVTGAGTITCVCGD